MDCGLVGRQPQHVLAYLVERPRDLAYLAGGINVDGPQARGHRPAIGLAHAADRIRQSIPGRLKGRGPQLVQRLQHRPGDGDDRPQRREQDHCRTDREHRQDGLVVSWHGRAQEARDADNAERDGGNGDGRNDDQQQKARAETPALRRGNRSVLRQRRDGSAAAGWHWRTRWCSPGAEPDRRRGRRQVSRSRWLPRSSRAARSRRPRVSGSRRAFAVPVPAGMALAEGSRERLRVATAAGIAGPWPGVARRPPWVPVRALPRCPDHVHHHEPADGEDQNHEKDLG